MTLLKDNNYKDINVALLSLEADIKNKITGFDTSVIDKQLAEINSRIDKINAGSNNSSAEINDIRYEIENINSKLNVNSAKIENIEQKLSDIFSAENKVTDFNTTTNSGIYYWLDDAANKPGTDYGVLLVNKYDGGSSTSIWVNQVAYGTNNKIYFRQNINSGNWTEWKAVAFEGEMKANFLDEYPGAGGTRLTSGNIVPKDASEYGGMRKDVVTSSMTDGHPEGDDGHLLTMFWDNSGRYDIQLFVSNDNPPTVKARSKANGADYGPWVDIITSNNIGSQTVAKAEKADTDANGNNIVNTYATKTELEKTTTKGVGLSTVTTGTTKYVKLGTFHWYDSFSFKCRIAGNSFEDNININILGGVSYASSVCGYYSTNSSLTESIIVKRGEAWNDEFEIYLKITQLTTDEVYVTIDKNIQDRINISESTTAPSGTLEEIAFNNLNGMFSGNIDAKYIKANSRMIIPIGAPSSLEDGCIWIS